MTWSQQRPPSLLFGKIVVGSSWRNVLPPSIDREAYVLPLANTVSGPPNTFPPLAPLGSLGRPPGPPNGVFFTNTRSFPPSGIESSTRLSFGSSALPSARRSFGWRSLVAGFGTGRPDSIPVDGAVGS